MAPNRNLKQRVYHGMKDFLFITCYLWVVFALFVLYRSVILSEQHIPFAVHGFALLNALALAKVMLAAQDLHFGESFNEAPLSSTRLFLSLSLSLLSWVVSKFLTNSTGVCRTSVSAYLT